MIPLRPRLLIGILTATVGLVGCETTATSDASRREFAAGDASAVVPDSSSRLRGAQLLRVGMHKPQVLELLGEPKHTEPPRNANGMRETWEYEIIHHPQYKTIVAQMELVPYVDPFTGELKWLEEPVQNQQRIQKHETLTLTFRGPRLIDLERQVRESNHFRD
jgi:outer membrane protein assembly factor BamE (lipoprotein component of BamABCDE complex)